MIIIKHRQNNINDLNNIPNNYGIEVDLRNHGEEIVVIHDPFNDDAVTFNEWLQQYKHSFLIVNVKEEGLEPKLIPLLEKNNVKEYFILDESLPFIRKFSLSGLSKFAVRVSEIESPETALNLVSYLREYGKGIDWVWLDSFTGNPLPQETLIALKAAGLKLCQVSPELHHVDTPNVWEGLIRDFLSKWDNSPAKYIDMVCTKLPEVWRQRE
ncbi:PI-PLC domain-containing protein [Agrobacterium tumefaciens]|uniref:hypothetical protein n=1 Tax=Agrobacterium tumefaciens TaxID=358 RepID=UPI000DD4E102|nr:hypothetical protein [Agrobacterium tumefaciens]MEA1844061.1 hypothetical protein [Agrobacterium tumefaciens]